MKHKKEIQILVWQYYGEPWKCRIVEFYRNFILSHLTKLISQSDVGLCRDDGLDAGKSLNGQHIGRFMQNIIQTLKNLCFKIEIKMNLIEVDFSNVTFELAKGRDILTRQKGK